MTLVALFAKQASAQSFTAPPAPSPGSTGNSLVINGNVTVDRLTLNVNFFPGNGVGVTVNSGTASLTNTTVNLGTSGGVKGLVANGPAATLTMGAGSSVNASGGGGGNFGVLVNGGKIFLTGGAFVNMPGGGGSSQVQVSSGGTFDMTNGSLTVSGGGGNAIRAGDNNTAGTISLNGTAVMVLGSGGDSSGVWANISGSNAKLVDTSVTVSGPGGGNFGVKATSGAGANLTGGSVLVVATGGGNIGLLADGSNSMLSAAGTTVVVTGNNNFGARSQNNASMMLTAGASVTVNGDNGTGVHLNNSGTISMTGGSVETTGSGGQAIFVSGSGQNQGTFDGTSVSSDSGTGILAQGSANSTLDFLNGASLTPGNGLLLLDQASGIVNLNGTTDVQFVGSIDATGASGTAKVTLQSNSSLTGAINQNQLTGAVGIEPAEPIANLPRQNVNLGIDGTSHWNMTASATLNTLAVNSGARVTFVDPPSDQPFKTLVMNNLVGTGATFGMNIDLGQIRGDLIAILTSSQGLHLIEFSNRDQSADLPVNVALLVVKTADGGAGFSGETDGGTFKYFVVHGADGSTVTPVKQNWYLVRADEITPPQVTPPVDPNPTPPPPKPPGEFTPGEVGPPPEVVVPPTSLSPINDLANTANAAIGTYSSTIPVYYADMQTLVERMGELQLGIQQAPVISEQAPEGKGVVASKQVAPVPAPPPSSEWGVWVRGFGSGMRINNDASRVFDQNVGGFQIGADKRFGSLWGGDVYLGVFGGYIYASRDFRDGGDGSTNALSLGGYATWIHPKGWYVDMVGKYTQMWNYFNTPTLEGSISTGYYNMPTFGGSLEIGKRFEFASGRFFIEPEAQLAGVWENGMNYTASNGLRVHGDDQTSLRGRLGGRVGMHFDLPQGRAIEPYVRAEAIEEFLTGNTVTTDSTSFDSHLSGTTGRFGGGLTARISQSFYIYGEYDYLTGDHIEQPWSVDAGLRWQW